MKQKFALILLCISPSLVLAGCVTDSGGLRTREENKLAVNGERTKFGAFWNLHPDCSAATLPNVRIIERPAHGTAEVVTEGVFPSGAKGKYAKCNGKAVKGQEIYYTSTPGYVGDDSIKLRSSYGLGYVDDVSIRVKVVK